MFALTHALTGFFISKTISNSKSNQATFAGVIGGIFPDFDMGFILFGFNSLHPMLTHRTISHSIILSPIWAFVLYVLAIYIIKFLKKPLEINKIKLYFIFLLGIISHILLDMSYNFGGVGIFSPFVKDFYSFHYLNTKFALSVEAISVIGLIIFWFYQNKKTLFKLSKP